MNNINIIKNKLNKCADFVYKEEIINNENYHLFYLSSLINQELMLKIIKNLLIFENNQEILNYNWRGNTGLEKIQNSLMDSFSNFEHQRLVYSASIMLRSPRLLGEQYLGLFSDFLPEIREKVYEGVEDGSIKTEYPEELADLIVLTLNIWIGFQISVFSLVELKRKMNFIKLTFEGLGVQLISDEMMEVIFNLFDHLKK